MFYDDDFAEELSNMENDHPGLATVFSNEADWSSVVPTLLLSKDPENVESLNKVTPNATVNHYVHSHSKVRLRMLIMDMGPILKTFYVRNLVMIIL